MKDRLCRKGLVFGIIVLFVGMSIIPLTGSTLVEKHVLKQSKILDDLFLSELDGQYDSYEDYKRCRVIKPFYSQKVREALGENDKQTIIVFINSDLMLHIEDEIAVYTSPMVTEWYNTVILEVTGGTVEDLKNQILYYWNTGYNVAGAVLIGDLSAAWYHHENDFGGAAEFPCDLFLMDLDGTWTDTDDDGLYDSHTNGAGDTAPEIFIGRIDASNIPGDEITITKNYLHKVYEYWACNITHTNFALTYTDKDWAYYQEFRHDIRYAYPDYEAFWYPDVSRDDYVNNRLPNDLYEFIMISCHAGGTWYSHRFENGGYVYSDEIRAVPPKALFYNLFTCSSLRFTGYNCLGNAYILDTNSPSLTVVGSTKVGAMLDFRFFYEPIGDGYSFGDAFQQWFEYEYPYSDGDISWFYGMTILGDPILIPNRLQPVQPHNFSVIRGKHISGGLADLFESDDSRLVIQAGPVLDIHEPPVWMVIDATAFTNSPPELRFTLEACVNTPGLTQKIELFNYVTQSYEQVDERAATTTDSVVEIIVSGDPSRFIDPGTLAMNAQMTWKPSGPILLWPYTVGIDQSIWSILQ